MLFKLRKFVHFAAGAIALVPFIAIKWIFIFYFFTSKSSTGVLFLFLGVLIFTFMRFAFFLYWVSSRRNVVRSWVVFCIVRRFPFFQPQTPAQSSKAGGNPQRRSVGDTS